MVESRGEERLLDSFADSILLFGQFLLLSPYAHDGAIYVSLVEYILDHRMAKLKILPAFTNV